MANGSGWHLDKRVSISHIITTVALIVSVVFWVGKIETRIALLEQSVKLQRDQIAQAFVATDNRLTRIEEKLDRVLEDRGK